MSTHHIITRGFLVRLKVWTFHFYSSNLILFSNYTSTTWIVFIFCFIVNLPLGFFSFFLTNKGYPHTSGYYKEDCFHFGSLKNLNIFISIPQIWFYFQIALLPLGLFWFWASLWISSSCVDLNLEIAAQFPCNLKSASTNLFFRLDLYWVFVIRAHQTSLSPAVDPI